MLLMSITGTVSPAMAIALEHLENLCVADYLDLPNQ
jgi:hypothetical protein